MKLRNWIHRSTEIMDNQESINIELDTSESLENDLNINIEKEQKELEDDPRKGKLLRPENQNRFIWNMQD